MKPIKITREKIISAILGIVIYLIVVSLFEYFTS